jgi:hypothetical protein
MTSRRIASGSDETEGNDPMAVGQGIDVIGDAAIDASMSGAPQEPDGGRFARAAVPVHL